MAEEGRKRIACVRERGSTFEIKKKRMRGREIERKRERNNKKKKTYTQLTIIKSKKKVTVHCPVQFSIRMLGTMSLAGSTTHA